MEEARQPRYVGQAGMDTTGETLVTSVQQQMAGALRGQEYQRAQQVLARLVRYGERPIMPSRVRSPGRRLYAWIRRRLQRHSGATDALANALAREDEAFYRQEEYERIAARALCTLLQWHHAIIAETLPAADGPERLADLQHFLAALRRAQDL